MSDRRPEKLERLKNENGYIYERSRQDVSPDVLAERLAQFDDLGADWQARNVPEFIFDLIAVARNPVAAVRSGVESGTIKGMRAWHCVSQMDLALYERPHWCRGMGHDDCRWALVLVDDSVVVHGKCVDVTGGPVSDGGSET